MLKLTNGNTITNKDYTLSIRKLTSIIEEFGGQVTSYSPIPVQMYDIRCFITGMTVKDNTVLMNVLKENGFITKLIQDYANASLLGLVFSQSEFCEC